MRYQGRANPLIIGTITLFVMLLALLFAYNANRGVPLTSPYELKALLPNASGLVKGNDVRIAGVRVGSVSDIQVAKNPAGETAAVVTMRFDHDIKSLPVNSTVSIRSRSLLGLKYVELVKGVSDETYESGATVPISQAHPATVELDQILNMFSDPTRTAIKEDIRTLGDALAGRGQALNTAIVEFAPLLEDLAPVSENLASPATGLQRFVRELGETTAIVAPAAETLAALFVNLDTTFTALAGVSNFIQDSIAQGPPTLQTAIDELPGQRPFLVNTTALMQELLPATIALRAAAPDLADAISAGAASLPQAPALNRRLAVTFETIQEFAEDPIVPITLRRAIETAQSLSPTLTFFVPTQTVCNYVTLWFRNIASLLSEGGSTGTWQRFLIAVTPMGPNSEGSPASAPANGPSEANHLHINPYPNTAAPGQVQECEAGREKYQAGRTVIGNVPGNQGTNTEQTMRERN